jgi:UDP-3-O-[3-hydroxymyristoyl] N-acetylglucosamine deacetylase
VNTQVQHTLAKSVSCKGIGLHAGLPVNMKLHPAPENHGIIFVRNDVKGFSPIIDADYRNVSSTSLGTTLSNQDGTIVSTVEHLMAALWGCNIDNAIIEINGPEIPIMDGSSEPFVFLIECAGTVAQKAGRKVVEVLKKVTVTEGDKFVTIEPASSFSVNMEIDFASKAISNQKCRFSSDDVSFKTDLSRARTFGFEHEVENLRKLGFARGGSLDNAVVVSGDRVLNKDGLRYANEFVRHKVLDAIGDFYLAGAYLMGKCVGYRSGHGLNNQLLRQFFADKSAWRYVEADVPAAIA